MEYKDVSIMVLRGQRNKAIKFLNVRGLFKISHGNRYGILFCTSVFRARLWTLFTTLCLMSRDTLFLLSSVFAHALARISLCALYGSDWYARRGTILGEPRTSTIFWTVRKIFCGHTGGGPRIVGRLIMNRALPIVWQKATGKEASVFRPPRGHETVMSWIFS